jgi:hypothetical protein
VALAGGIVVVGVLVATRPVGDQAFRKGAIRDAAGTVATVRQSWYGDQIGTVQWSAPNGDAMVSRFEADASPPYAVGDEYDLAFNPGRPAAGVVPSDPGEANNGYYRVNAVLQSGALFTLAGLVIFLLVLCPLTPPPISGRAAPQPVTAARAALRPYLAAPLLAVLIVLAASMAVQDRSAYSRPVATVSGLLAFALIPLLIWSSGRAIRHRRIVRVGAVPDDAVYPRAVVASILGQRIWVDTASTASGAEGVTYLLVTALRGQSTDGLSPGDRVDVYGLREPTRAVLLSPADGPGVVGVASRQQCFDPGPIRSSLIESGAPAAREVRPDVVQHLRRQARRYVVRRTITSVVVVVASVTLIGAGAVRFHLENADLGGNGAGQGWAALGWTGVALLVAAVIFGAVGISRFWQLSGVLSGPHVVRQGRMVGLKTSALRRAFGMAAAAIHLPDALRPDLKVRFICGGDLPMASGSQPVVVLTNGDGGRGPAVLMTPGGHRAIMGICRPRGAYRLDVADGFRPVRFRIKRGDLLAENGEVVASPKRQKSGDWEILASGRRFSYRVEWWEGGSSTTVRDQESGEVVLERGFGRMLFGPTSYRMVTSERDLALVDDHESVVLEAHADEVNASSQLEGPRLPLLAAAAYLSRPEA